MIPWYIGNAIRKLDCQWEEFSLLRQEVKFLRKSGEHVRCFVECAEPYCVVSELLEKTEISR